MVPRLLVLGLIFGCGQAQAQQTSPPANTDNPRAAQLYLLVTMQDTGGVNGRVTIRAELAPGVDVQGRTRVITDSTLRIFGEVLRPVGSASQTSSARLFYRAELSMAPREFNRPLHLSLPRITGLAVASLPAAAGVGRPVTVALLTSRAFELPLNVPPREAFPYSWQQWGIGISTDRATGIGGNRAPPTRVVVPRNLFSVLLSPYFEFTFYRSRYSFNQPNDSYEVYPTFSTALRFSAPVN